MFQASILSHLSRLPNRPGTVAGMGLVAVGYEFVSRQGNELLVC